MLMIWELCQIMQDTWPAASQSRQQVEWFSIMMDIQIMTRNGRTVMLWFTEECAIVPAGPE
jgi:hypothetical protein